MIYHLSVKILVIALAFGAMVCAQLCCGAKGHLIYRLTPTTLVRAITAWGGREAAFPFSPKSHLLPCFSSRDVCEMLFQQIYNFLSFKSWFSPVEREVRSQNGNWSGWARMSWRAWWLLEGVGALLFVSVPGLCVCSWPKLPYWPPISYSQFIAFA